MFRSLGRTEFWRVLKKIVKTVCKRMYTVILRWSFTDAQMTCMYLWNTPSGSSSPSTCSLWMKMEHNLLKNKQTSITQTDGTNFPVRKKYDNICAAIIYVLQTIECAVTSLSAFVNRRYFLLSLLLWNPRKQVMKSRYLLLESYSTV